MSTGQLAPDVNVSRETWDRLCIYENLLRRWQTRINLVSNSTLDALVHRHFADSAQILPYVPTAKIFADMGSGAGFPGLVLGILIESDAKKCAFLREVIRETSARAEVHRGRVEDILPTLRVDVVMARALASLSKLLDYAAPSIRNGATGAFLKGQDVHAELTGLGPHSSLKFEIHPSKTAPKGALVLVRRPDE